MLNRPVISWETRFVWVTDTATILKEGYCEGQTRVKLGSDLLSSGMFCRVVW
jgi:hypothetical protein